MNERRPLDSYPTPHSIIQAVIDNIQWEPCHVWEPAAGDGRFSTALRHANFQVTESDIITGNDFFDFQQPLADNIITNPPFRLIRNWIDHAFNIGVKRMILVCPERLWACGKGHNQWVQHRPTRVVNLSWREDYLGKSGAPDRALAISIWDWPRANSCQYEIWNKPARVGGWG
jgi:hypothetical protein